MSSIVNAPPEAVWPLVIDVERWPDINPSYRSLRRVDSGALQVGSEAIIKQRGLPKARWRVTAMEPGRSFTWETNNGGVTTVATHIVERDVAGSNVTLALRVSGPLARVTHAIYGRRIRRFLSLELAGFGRAATAMPDPG